MKKGVIIALAIALIGAAGALVWYLRLKNERASTGKPYDNTLSPRLELSRFDITDIDEEAINLNMYLLIDNPLPVGFKAHQVDYTVYIANTPIVVDSYKKPIEVRSGDSTVVALPAKLLSKKLNSVLDSLYAKHVDTTTYTLRTTFALDLPILGKETFAVTSSKRAPTYYVPTFKVTDIDFGPLNLKSQDIAARVAITNRNKFPYNIVDTHYSVTINGKQIAEGDQPEPILVKADATTPVVFPVTGKPGKTLSVLPKMLFDKKDTPYEVAFRCKIIDKKGNLAFKNSKVVTTIRGTLDDFKKKK